MLEAHGALDGTATEAAPIEEASHLEHEHRVAAARERVGQRRATRARADDHGVHLDGLAVGQRAGVHHALVPRVLLGLHGQDVEAGATAERGREVRVDDLRDLDGGRGDAHHRVGCDGPRDGVDGSQPRAHVELTQARTRYGHGSQVERTKHGHVAHTGVRADAIQHALHVAHGGLVRSTHAAPLGRHGLRDGADERGVVGAEAKATRILGGAVCHVASDCGFSPLALMLRPFSHLFK